MCSAGKSLMNERLVRSRGSGISLLSPACSLSVLTATVHACMYIHAARRLCKFIQPSCMGMLLAQLLAWPPLVASLCFRKQPEPRMHSDPVPKPLKTLHPYLSSSRFREGISASFDARLTALLSNGICRMVWAHHQPGERERRGYGNTVQFGNAIKDNDP